MPFARKDRFIGRKKELESLNRLYHREGFSMTVITGRRRIGKSTLIGEFIRDKKAIYYTASKVGYRRNLELLTEQAVRLLDPGISGIVFRNLENLLDFITTRIEREKLVFVIDEFPYWAQDDEKILSVLQKYIDTKWQEKNMYLILCGSSLSFMEDKVLSEKSPLFGRRDSQIRLKEFSYLEAAEFVPDYSYEDKAICFGVTGGVAKYLAMFDPERTLDENIQMLFFKSDGYLYDEPHNLLTQEFSDVTIVNNIIEQIADGENTLNLIADKIHENPSTVSYSLSRLISTGLIEKKYCITEEKNKKKVQYVLKDNMFKFWYEFIPGAISLIEIGHGEDYYIRVVKPRLHSYMGRIFEEMCRYFTLLEGASGAFGCLLTEVGSWWGDREVS
ncbi:MAG: ATP-binding protein [Eubacterium sp.]|nr:ATP-binding protein [Eubacterium sp.]